VLRVGDRAKPVLEALPEVVSVHLSEIEGQGVCGPLLW
jgi:hypothetical protein